jgi:hypothetical protein
MPHLPEDLKGAIAVLLNAADDRAKAAEAREARLREALVKVHEWHGGTHEKWDDSLCICGRALASPEAET